MDRSDSRPFPEPKQQIQVPHHPHLPLLPFTLLHTGHSLTQPPLRPVHIDIFAIRLRISHNPPLVVRDPGPRRDEFAMERSALWSGNFTKQWRRGYMNPESFADTCLQVGQLLRFVDLDDRARDLA